MRWRIAISCVGVLCCALASGQQVAVPLTDTDTGSGLSIEGPEEIEPRFSEDYDVYGLETANLARAKIMVFPEKGVRVRTGRPWGDGAPYVTLRVTLPEGVREQLYRLWVVVDHVPRIVPSKGLGVADTMVHVPDEWAHIDILVKRPGPPPPPPDPPDLTINDQTVGEDGSAAALQVQLSKPAPADVSFGYATKDGTATAGNDFTSTHGSGTILMGSSFSRVSVPILEDEDAEGAETFTLELSNVTNANALKTVATVTIEDNDKPAIEELAGVIIHDPQDEANQGGNFGILMYGPPINDILGDEKWQPISTEITTTHEWLSDLIDEVVGGDLPEPHVFLMDWETKEVVWSGQLSRDIDEVIETVERFMP